MTLIVKVTMIATFTITKIITKQLTLIRKNNDTNNNCDGGEDDDK